jgi:hypothetical protein
MTGIFSTERMDSAYHGGHLAIGNIIEWYKYPEVTYAPTKRLAKDRKPKGNLTRMTMPREVTLTAVWNDRYQCYAQI